MRPMDVKISGHQRPLAAGQVHEFGCLSSGSRPAAKLVWLKNGKLLNQSELAEQKLASGASGGSTRAPNSRAVSSWTSTQSDSPPGQQRSKLALKLERQDHGAQLTCRAVNEKALTLVHSSQSSAAASAHHQHSSDSRRPHAQTPGQPEGPGRQAEVQRQVEPETKAASLGEEVGPPNAWGWQLEDSVTLSVQCKSSPRRLSRQVSTPERPPRARWGLLSFGTRRYCLAGAQTSRPECDHFQRLVLTSVFPFSLFWPTKKPTQTSPLDCWTAGCFGPHAKRQIGPKKTQTPQVCG